MSKGLKLFSCLAVTVSFALSLCAPAFAQKEEVYSLGKEEYSWSCLPCHGEKGTGDGGLASILTKKPSNLTQIAKNNDGEFPFWRVYKIVSGREEVPGHTTMQMPDYWSRYRAEEDEKGFLPSEVRILLLTHYLESIQDK